MTLARALKMSPFGYARRYVTERGVWLYRTGGLEFIEAHGQLCPVKRTPGQFDWLPIEDYET